MNRNTLWRIRRIPFVAVTTLLVGSTLIGPRVFADEGAPAATLQQAPEEEHRIFGLMLDVGAPDAVGISLLGRPWRALRISAGAIGNGATFGVRTGLTYVPFDAWISPSITVEGGWMFEGNANKITKLFGLQSDALDKIGYRYANAHIGFEIGSPNRFLFFIHGGLTYLVSTVHKLQDIVRNEANDPTINFQDPKMKLLSPSAKFGFVLYL